MHHDGCDPTVTINDLVVEVDLTFDGRNDILLFERNQSMNTMARYRCYRLFLEGEDQLEYVPSTDFRKQCGND